MNAKQQLKEDTSNIKAQIEEKLDTKIDTKKENQNLTKEFKENINALKNLSEQTDLENTVDIEEVIRYFVVHGFLCNGDSYTGSMIHNYYLYEEDGKLSMIPWDYNLAYGTFQAEDADSAVNDPIDTPLSVTEGSDDRPMFSWITSCDEYLEMYHA